MRPAPLLLLAAYETGVDTLQPGTRFTLTVDIQNAGTANAANTIITFGTVTSTGNGSGDSSTGSNGSSTGGTSSTPSSTFAPLGSAGLSFIGDIETGELVQEVTDVDFVSR